MQECKRLSYSERLGRWGIVRVVWGAIPWRFRLFALPYCLLVYSKFFADSSSVDDVKSMHIERCYESKIFRIFRPRFRIVKRALLAMDLEAADQTVQEAVTTVLPIPEVREQQRPAVPSNAV